MRKGLLAIIVTIIMTFALFPITVQASENAHLGMRWAMYDSTTGTFYENMESPLETYISRDPGNSPLFLYFVDENGVETGLDMSQVSISDESVLSFEKDGNIADMLHGRFKKIGSTSIEYVYNGTTYSMPITVCIPALGFYSTATVNAENHLLEYTVTDEGNNKIYLVPNGGTINSAVLTEEFSKIASIQMSEDNSYAEIVVTGTPQNGSWYAINTVFTDSYGNECTWMVGITLLNGKTSLQFSHIYWENGVPAMNEYRNSSMYIAKGYSNSVYTLLVSAESEQKVKANDLTSSDESIMKVSQFNDHSDIASIEAVDFGTALLSYTDSTGKVYSMEVTVGLPDVGFYTTSTASQETYLTEFTVTDEGPNKFYVVSRNGAMNSIELDSSFAKEATIQMGSDNTYAEITITGAPGDNWYGIRAKVTNENGYENTYGTNIKLINRKSALQFSYVNWQGEPQPWEDLHSSIYVPKYYGSNIYAFFVSDGNKLPIVAEGLASANESIAKVRADENYPDMVIVEGVDFGTTTISYTHSDGKTYSIEVEVGLPDLGYYTTPTASEESYISQYMVTEEGPNTFYLISRAGEIESIELSDKMSSIATAQMGSDNTYAEITVTGVPESKESYYISADITNEYGYTNPYGASIWLKNGIPSLQCAFGYWDENGVFMPNELLFNNLNIAKEDEASIYMYFITGDTKQVVTADKLLLSDESVLKLCEHPDNADAISLEAVDFGSTTLSYTHTNGKTYSMEVSVGLPVVGFYTTPTATEESYITKYTVTEESSNKIYLVSRGETLNSVELRNTFGEIATVTISDDNSYAEIIITGTPEDTQWCTTIAKTTQYGYENTWWIPIVLENRKPHIALAFQDENTEAEHGDFFSFLYTAVGYTADVWVYYVDSENETMLRMTDLKSSDESIIKIVDSGYNNGMVTLKTVGWGQTTITGTYGGKTYSIDVISELPDFGFYSTSTRSEESWIRNFTVTEEKNEFYYIVKEGYVFDSFELLEDLQNIATVTLSDDRTYAKITVIGKPQEDVRYGIKYEYSSLDGMEFGGSRDFLDYLIYLNVEIDELPTIDPSVPVEDVEVGVDSSSEEVLGEVATDLVEEIVSGEGTNNVSAEVSASIKNALDNGAELKISTSVVVEKLVEDNIQDTATKEDVSAIETAKGEGQVAQYLNLSVVVTTYVNGTQDAEGNVSKLDAPIIFTVALSEEVKTVPEGFERNIYVIYVHDGVVKTIPVTENADGTVSFEANEFSTYALAYKDTKTLSPVEAFVSRMYQQCLSRDPDQNGLEGWVSQLEGGYMNGAQIAEQFVFSNEMLKKNLSNEEFVNVLYRAMMGREADVAGRTGWVNELNNGYLTRSQVTKAFVESTEFTNICSEYGIVRGDYDASVAPIEHFVTRFYTLCLERDPDQEGMYGWVNNLKHQYMNGAQIAEAFIFSDEFVGKNVSDEKYVELLYNTLLGRPSDENGKKGWVGELQGGYMTRRGMMKAFIDSIEFGDICEEYGITRGTVE